MSDAKLPLIHKAPVEGLAIHVARTGLSIGDPAWLDRLSDGRIGRAGRRRYQSRYRRLSPEKRHFGRLQRTRYGLIVRRLRVLY